MTIKGEDLLVRRASEEYKILIGPSLTEYSPQAEEVIERKYRSLSEWDFLTFVQGLRIPTSMGDLLFAEEMARFQSECLESLAPNLEALREGQMPDCRRFWIERTKKASKDGDLGCALLWLMAFPHKPLLIRLVIVTGKHVMMFSCFGSFS